MAPANDVIYLCSAALITCFTFSKKEGTPQLYYAKMSSLQSNPGKSYHIDLCKMLGTSSVGTKYESLPRAIHFLSEKLCCIGFTAQKISQEDLSRGICRRLCLLVLGWNGGSEELTEVASAVIEIRDQFLAHLPNTQYQTQCFPLMPPADFIQTKKHLFSIYHPSLGGTPCLLIHCMHGSTFVPITGNTPAYPGLYTFDGSEFLIPAWHYRTSQAYLFLGKAIQRHADGRSAYQYCRLILK